MDTEAGRTHTPWRPPLLPRSYRAAPAMLCPARQMFSATVTACRHNDPDRHTASAAVAEATSILLNTTRNRHMSADRPVTTAASPRSGARWSILSASSRTLAARENSFCSFRPSSVSVPSAFAPLLRATAASSSRPEARRASTRRRWPLSHSDARETLLRASCTAASRCTKGWAEVWASFRLAAHRFDMSL